MFQTPFDQETTAARVAKRENTTVDVILARWKAEADKACDYGTMIHAKMEDYLKCGAIDPDYQELYRTFDNIIGNEVKRANEVLSEFKLHNDDYLIAGTADLIIDLNDEEFIVGDFKTNKEIKFFNRWGQHLLAPVSHLSDCNYNIYSLQLSLYGYFYSLVSGKRCRNVFLMYCHDKSGWQFIPANYMEYEVRAMLRYYEKNRESMKHK